MAEASISVDQDRFICPVCLDLLKDPVTIPCGHSFCKVCINDCWDQEDQKGVYRCPQCRDTFTPRPVLRRNNMLAEVVEKLKKTEVQAASPAHCYAGPGDVECDFCTVRKRKAVKSCLMCLASSCEAHLKPHYEVPALKKHKLVEAITQLNANICSQHDRLIDIYCHTDKRCVCYICTVDGHKGHDTVPAAVERSKKQYEVTEVQRKSQQRIREKQKKVQELKQAVNTIKSRAQTAVEDSEIIFTEMISSMEKRRSEVTERIRAQEKAELSRAERLLEQLEQEIADLQRRDTELEQLSHTHDHVQFFQCFQSLCDPSGCKESQRFTVNHQISFERVKNSLFWLKKQLEEFCNSEFNKIHPHVAAVQLILHSEPRTRDEFMNHFCRLTLDPYTAHRNLLLSERNTVVTGCETEQPCYLRSSERYYCGLAMPSERFDYYWQVLCNESLRDCCYWEVERVNEGYLEISVSYKDISRTGDGKECGFGFNDRSWSLVCSSSTCYFCHKNKKTELKVRSPSKVGVYVDSRAGILSFYNVCGTMTLLYRTRTKFSQPLYAGFRVGLKSTMKLCNQSCYY
ncbi:tripartite motif-containing protein 16 [Ictalurus punctatus]|uniref:Tripartite motif-containing protein 16 n=1 Tax=Ictalurus punctatus TaxID=7998 RepID=A0A2D0Q0T5_ICTPU|nr:tripartite motif-containing protein 16 [Ictalurus punctatus]